ncbi:restriction endonuclease subunit S [Parafannyhessea umbonata]|uniref:restriction endonuclease subunit S n=1 Tax=Parafannyhessea umbonata TaxID=604330 RepID=UPI0026F31633|nr:restriction endonuclease subunit S [Parafannyhessea umbonata]MDD7199575.1 restriction endonuclease subunit S [Parafannyhessea umbonata]MDY4418444.1 restriction endonuclease subunit S [Parafannyhessea umbonata]
MGSSDQQLQDICQLIVDCPHSSAKDEGAGYPLIRTPNVGRGRLILNGVQRVSRSVYLERVSRAVPRQGDLILAREAPAGNVAIIDSDYPVCLGQRTMLLRPDNNLVNPYFLVYYLNAPEQRARLLRLSNGATVPHVNVADVRAFPVHLPTRARQDRIASVIKPIDDILTLHACTNGYLYECCTAKMIDIVSSSDRTMTVGECCESIYSGGTPSTKKAAYWNGNLPWLSSGETRCRFIIDTEKTITELGVAESSTKLAKAGDVVMASAGQGFTRGQTSMLFFDTYVNQSVVVMRPRRDYGAYLLLMLAAQYDNLRAWSDSTSTRGSMSGKLLRQFELPYFDVEQAKELTAFTAPMFAMIEKNMRESKALAQTRDALLPKLMSGEIDVSEVELPKQPNSHLCER